MDIITQLSRNYAMRRIACIAILLTMSLLLAACVRDPENIQNTQNRATEDTIAMGTVTEDIETFDATIGSETLSNSSSEYGVMQEIVDSYGFPFHFRMTEGMEMTKVSVFSDHAERDWMSNNSSTLYEHLAWSIIEDHLTISGEWEEEFIIDIDSGTLTSLSTQKVYKLAVHDGDDFKWYTDLPDE